MFRLRRYNPDLEEAVLRAKAGKLYRDTGSIKAVSRKLNISEHHASKLLKSLTIPKVSWERAIDSLKNKGYGVRELARFLCQRIGCNEATALTWFAKRNTPNLPTQDAIAKLDEKLPTLVSSLDIPWEKAVDSLKNKGYGNRELARFLCQRIGCKAGTAQHWFAKRKIPNLLIQEAIVKLDEELREIPWEKAVDSLKNKGYGGRELAKLLCQRIGCNKSTAVRWFAKRNTPNLPAQDAIIKLDEELLPLISRLEIPWEDAVNNLKSKGYSGRELAVLLYQRIGCNKSTAVHWFAKRRTPKLPIQEAIVKLDRELPRKTKKLRRYNPDLEETVLRAKAQKLYRDTGNIAGVSKKLNISREHVRKLIKGVILPQIPWKKAVEELLSKGYSRVELARRISLYIKCDGRGFTSRSAKDWFGVRTPPYQVQSAIVKLNMDLPALAHSTPIPWKEAIKSLLRKGYSKAELSRRICQIIPCKFDTAKDWFSRMRRPPWTAQKAIAELDKTLPSLAKNVPWKAAVDSLARKGYLRPRHSGATRRDLAARLNQLYPSDINTAARCWFTKKNTPPLPAQEAIVKLNQLLPTQVPQSICWESAVDSLHKKGYSTSELARQLRQRISCSVNTARLWLIKKYTPPAKAQVAIWNLNKELPAVVTIPWKEAVDSLLRKGYSKNELSIQLCRQISCNAGTAKQWFAKKFAPPPWIQETIVKLNQTLPYKTKKAITRRSLSTPH